MERTVRALGELARRRGLEFAIEVGQAVIDGIYGGDVRQMRDSTGRCPSLRALARHPAMPISAATLHTCIGVYLLTVRRPDVLGTRLTVTHLRAVLPLSVDAQDRLIAQAVAEGWSSEVLQRAARAERPKGKGGRPRLPQVVKTVNRLRSITDDPGGWQDVDDVAAMSVEERARLRRSVAAIERRLRGVRLQLEEAQRQAQSGQGGDCPG